MLGLAPGPGVCTCMYSYACGLLGGCILSATAAGTKGFGVLVFEGGGAADLSSGFCFLVP